MGNAADRKKKSPKRKWVKNKESIKNIKRHRFRQQSRLAGARSPGRYLEDEVLQRQHVREQGQGSECRQITPRQADLQDV